MPKIIPVKRIRFPEGNLFSIYSAGKKKISKEITIFSPSLPSKPTAFMISLSLMISFSNYPSIDFK